MKRLSLFLILALYFPLQGTIIYPENPISHDEDTLPVLMWDVDQVLLDRGKAEESYISFIYNFFVDATNKIELVKTIPALGVEFKNNFKREVDQGSFDIYLRQVEEKFPIVAQDTYSSIPLMEQLRRYIN